MPAGVFRCRHFSFEAENTREIPTSHVYVTGEDSRLVRYDWKDLDLEYVLVSLGEG